MDSLSLGTCKRHGARYTCVLQDALSLPEVETTESQGGQEDDDIMSPLGSALGSPQIGAGWGDLTAGASSSSDVEQRFEVHSEGAFGMDEAASSADAGSVADVSSTADGGDGGDGGVKEDRWEEVTRAPRKSKRKVLPIKSKGSKSNAGHSGNRQKSRLGNASNVLEVPRPSGNTGKSRLGNASNVVEVPRPKAK